MNTNVMDNRFTRKEEMCPIAGALCDCDDKNCNSCITKEVAWEIAQLK